MKLALYCTVLAVTFAVRVQAIEAMLTSFANEGGISQGTAGWTFQPLTDISVTALGAFQYAVTNTPAIEVGLWNATGTLLASNTVTTASLLLDQSMYESITPVTLTAGQTYYLGAFGGPMVIVAYDPTEEPGSVTMAPEIQLGAAVASTNNDFEFPSGEQGLPGSAVLLPNFQFTVVSVPEPTIFCLFGGGLFIFFTRRRR